MEGDGADNLDSGIDIEAMKRALTNEDVSELTGLYNSGGFSAVVTMLKEKKNSWKTIPVNIAVTGESGSGKSSLVNALIGLRAEDEGAAEVGVTESTAPKMGYEHPSHPNVMLWDLPGMGTLNIPADTYLDEMDFTNFDFFIIVSSERFTKNDMRLATEIKQRGRKFHFVRSKVDQDVSNSSRDHPRKPRQDVIQSMRDEIKRKLGADFENTPIFFIDNYKQGYDFQSFTMHIATNLPELQREAFVFSVDTLSTSMLDQKEALLRSRLLRSALLSAVAGVSPVPGSSIVVDIIILQVEFSFYKKQFGLDDESLRKLADVVHKDFDLLKSEIKLKLAREAITPKVITNLLNSATKIVTYSTVHLLRLVPIIGLIVGLFGAGVSFCTTYYILQDTLTKMRKEADRVLLKAFE